MPVEYSSSEIAGSGVGRTSGTVQQDHAGSLDGDSARPVSFGSAHGEHAAVSGPSGQASSADSIPVRYSGREIAVSEVDRTSGTVQQDHAGSFDADSAHLVSTGPARGEYVAVSGPSEQASSADPIPVGFSSRQLAMSEVGQSSGLAAPVGTAAITAPAPDTNDPATGLPVSTVTGQQGAASAVISAPTNPGVTSGNTGASQVGKADGIDPVGRAQAPGVTQSALGQTAGGAQTVRTIAPSSQLPGTSLFQVHPSPSAGYLIETDPRFVNYQQWTGSDYMFAQMKLDPALTQKRLGDGFYEQKLVRDQVAQLTGQRFLICARM